MKSLVALIVIVLLCLVFLAHRGCELYAPAEPVECDSGIMFCDEDSCICIE